jgi:Flp pilus assembly protein TadD
MRRAVFASIGLVVLVYAVFLQTRRFEFVNYDDAGNVSGQPGLREGLSPAGVRWAFTTTLVGNYIPVTALSFLADYETHGLHPGGYHLTNVALHALTVVLLFLFLYRTTGALWTGALVAALFAVHPLRAESVAWVSSRKDLVCGVFWMLTLHAYAGYVKRPGAWRYALVFAGVCGALLSKPMAVTLPFVLLLVDVWPLQRARYSEGRRLAWLALEKAPFLAAAIAASAITVVIQQRSGAVTPVDALPLGLRAANALVSYAAYLWKTVWPADLVPMYPFPAEGIAAWRVGGAAFVLIAITVAALIAARRAPWALTGWLWYLGTLVPVIGLVQVGGQAMADRYSYLPQIGVLIVLAWGLRAIHARWPRRAPLLAMAALGTIAALATVAYRQTTHWRDSLALWSHTAAITPRSVVARSSLGEAYLQRDESESARGELGEALRLQPTHRPALQNLALVEIRQGRFDEAIALCQTLIGLRADDPDAHTVWAFALIRQERYELALAHLTTALNADPDHADALSNRGATLLLLGRPGEAVVTLERAAARAPDDAVVLTNLAAAHYALGHGEEARRYSLEALRRDPVYERALALQRALDAAPH